MHTAHLIKDLCLQNIKNSQNSKLKRNSNYPVRKQAKHMDRHFTESDTQLENKHKKIYSISLTIRETHRETPKRYRCSFIRMPEIKIVVSPNVGKDRKKPD